MPHHVIETDFEPDDAIAILAHAAQFTNIDLTVIVGESKPNEKLPYVRKFLNAIRIKYPNAYKSIKVIQGLGSKKKYPAPEFIETFTTNFGETVVNLDHFITIMPNEDSEETILTNYTEEYSTNPEFAFMMKPPREAIKLRLQCPNTTVYCYGSFNFRTLKLQTQDYVDLMSRYKKFYYFDSFTAIGEKNSGMFKAGAWSKNSINDQITELIIKWNKHIIADCENDLVELMQKENRDEKDEKSIQRTKKIISNVSENVKEQFVMADLCLFLCPLPTQQVELADINPYPKWVPSTTSNVYIYSGAPVPPAGSTPETEERRAKLLENLNELIG